MKIWFGVKMFVFAFMGIILVYSIKTVERLSCIETTDKMYMLIAIMFISFWLIKLFWDTVEAQSFVEGEKKDG